LWGKKPEPQLDLAKLPEELKALITKAQDERTKFAAQIGKAKLGTDKLAELEVPLQQLQAKTDAANQRLAKVDERTGTLEALARQVDELARRFAAADQQQQQTQ